MPDADPEDAASPDAAPGSPSAMALGDLLTGITRGNSASTGELSTRLYAELRRMARAYMRQERRAHTLQPTALANEAFLRLSRGADIDWQGRSHFLALAARAMRAILVDHARRRGAQKRGGDRQRVPLEQAEQALGRPDLDVLDLQGLLEQLEALDARKARIVEMRFFAGMTAKGMAEVLGVSTDTVQDDWYGARAWLRARLDS